MTKLSDYENKAPMLAHHRALILKILSVFGGNEGLTTQQIIEHELRCYKFSFLTDNRLRELRKDGYIESVNELGKPQRWRIKQLETETFEENAKGDNLFE